MTRGRAWSVASGLLLAALFVVAMVVPVPYATLSPGPVFNILGDFDGKPVLSIGGAESFPTTGELDMTTVAESGGPSGSISGAVAIWGLLHRDTSVVPLEERYPDGVPGPDRRSQDEHVFDTSESKALAAAARYLRRPVSTRAVVYSVVPGSPAEGVLRAGDVILNVDGDRVVDSAQVAARVRRRRPGQSVSIRARRGDDVQSLELRTVADPRDPRRAIIGIAVETQYSSDFTVTVSLQDIGGPSAGLMLSIGMVDKLTPGDLLRGRHVAGTGTIDADGRVGPIGGIDKKMIAAANAGARLFVAPGANCAEIRGAIPEGLQVASVSSLSDSLAALRAWNERQVVPACPDLSAAPGSG